MATPQLGMKYTCYQCGTKFYDMKKPQPICPKCSANQKNAPPEPKQKHDKHAAVDDEEEEDVAPKRVADDDEPPGIDEEGAEAEEEEEEEEEY